MMKAGELLLLGGTVRKVFESVCVGSMLLRFFLNSLGGGLQYLEGNLNDLEFPIASSRVATGLNDLVILQVDSDSSFGATKIFCQFLFKKHTDLISLLNFLCVYEQCRRNLVMTSFVSITGFVGHAVREAKKILNTTKSKSVVVVSGRLICSRYNICAFARIWSAADAPPKSIMVKMEPIIIPPNICSMRAPFC